MPRLSVTIITKNEANKIRACLESVRFADEIIVLDSGSTDNTVEICKAYTNHVYITDWPGFGIQKNRAIDKATGDWILSIDADEVVTPTLQAHIKTIIHNKPQFAAYRIRRLSRYCGKLMRFGDWRNDYVLRLFQKDAGRFNELPVHESLQITDKVGTIHAIIDHHSFLSLDDVLKKTNQYSTLGAQRLYTLGRHGGIIKGLLHAYWCFFRGYFLRGGFLDGGHGFLLAKTNAEGTFYRYAKLGLLNDKPTPEIEA